MCLREITASPYRQRHAATAARECRIFVLCLARQEQFSGIQRSRAHQGVAFHGVEAGRHQNQLRIEGADDGA